jgi:hypothetical protein
VVVEVARVVAEDRLGVAAVEQEHAVGALLVYRAHEAFRVGVAVGTVWRNGDGGAITGEDRVKRGSELGVAIPDEVVELMSAFADLPQPDDPACEDLSKLDAILARPRARCLGRDVCGTDWLKAAAMLETAAP